MTRRWLAVAAAAGTALVAGLAPAPAAAGTVEVSQCGVADQADAPRAFQAGVWSVSNGYAEVRCGMPGGTMRFDTGYHRLPYFGSMIASFGLPASMPHTTLGTLWLDWTAMPQAPSTDPAFLIAWAGGARVLEAPSGSGTRPGVGERRELPVGARGIAFQTWCSSAHGPGWCWWPSHLLELRGFTVALEEATDPTAQASGALLSDGRVAGVEPLVVAARDADTGVRHIRVRLGGVVVGDVDLGAACRDDRLPPCPQEAQRTVDVDTRRVPDGRRPVRLEITDAAGNQRIVDLGTVLVANTTTVSPPPRSAPPSPHPRGGAPGVPPAAPPALFPPNPLAGRGHVPNGRHADARARLTAWFELPRRLGGRHVRSATIPPGVRIRIRGRLTDRHGRGIAHASLAMVMRIHGRPSAATGVRTRQDGRFTTFTRYGPSRTLRFAYYAYGDSRHPRRSPLLSLTVRRR